jgi:hypothetical protein
LLFSLSLGKDLKVFKLIAVLIFVTALGTKAFSLPPDRPQRPKPLPIPPAVEIDMTNTSADSYIKNMFFSLPVTSSDPRLVSNVDLYQVEVADIKKASSGGYGDPKKLSIGYGRYEFTMAAAKALVEAKNAGVQNIQVSTHLANALKYPPGAIGLITDFSKVEYQDNEKGMALKYLIDNGFKYNDPNFGIAGPPFQPNSPLMHEKALVIYEGKLPETPTEVLNNFDQTAQWLTKNLVTEDVKIHSFWGGTNNHTDSARINRTILTENPIAGKYYIWHLRNQMNTYKLGLPTDKMPVEPPLKIKFAKGDFVWIAGTNGTRNLNDVRVQTLGSTFDEVDPRTNQITKPRTHKLLFNFAIQSVDTDSRTYDSMQKALRANPNAIDQRIVDQSFARNGNFSVLEGRLGLIVVRPFDGDRNIVFPYFPTVRNQEQVWIWQRLAPGGIYKSREGNPVWNWTLHDKTEDSERAELQKPGSAEPPKETADITTGSENGSGNFPNAELRFWFHVERSSPTNAMFKDTILGTIRSDPRYVIPGVDGILRDELAWLVGHNLFEIPQDGDPEDVKRGLPTLEKIQDSLKNGDYDGVVKMLQEIAKTPTTLTEKTSPEAVNLRLKKFADGLKWYQNLPPAQKNLRDNPTGKMSIMHVIELAEVLNSKLYPDQVSAKLDNILYSKDLKFNGGLKLLVDQLAERLEFKILPPQGPPEHHQSAQECAVKLAGH